LSGGLWTIAAIVLQKSLNGSNFEVTIFSMIGPITALFAIFAAEWMRGRDKRRFIFWSGLFGRLPMVLMLFISDSTIFILLAFLSFICGSVLTPAVNSLLQTNLTRRTLGRMYGWLTVLTTVTLIIATVASGYILQWDPNSYHWLFGLSAVLGIASSTVIAQIRPRRTAFVSERTLYLRHVPFMQVLRTSFIVPLRSNASIMLRNKGFAIFERNFFLYGLAFMVLLPVVPIFLVERLNIAYDQAGMALGLFSQIGILVMTPIFAIIYDRLHPVSFSRWVFLLLGFYPLTLLASGALSSATGTSPIIWAYIAYLIFGFGMAGLSLVWMLGSIHFAGRGDATPYSGIHTTLVGLRGMVGPLIGYFVNLYFGPEAVFVLGAALFWLASLLMWKLYRDIHAGRVAEVEA
jgi:MFS family permease